MLHHFSRKPNSSIFPFQIYQHKTIIFKNIKIRPKTIIFQFYHFIFHREIQTIFFLGLIVSQFINEIIKTSVQQSVPKHARILKCVILMVGLQAISLVPEQTNKQTRFRIGIDEEEDIRSSRKRLFTDWV
jgi:hypothetical protein